MQEIAILALFFGFAFLGVYTLARTLAEEIYPDCGERRIEYPDVPEFFVPLLRFLALQVEKRVSPDNAYIAKLRKRMSYSRSFRTLSPSELVALQLFLAIIIVCLGVLVLLVNKVSPLEDPVAFLGFVAIMGVLGFSIPTLPMDNAIVRRQQSILRNWPFFMDLLTISIEAGMDFTSAVKRIARDMGRNSLTEEMLQYLNEVQLGKRKVDAIRAMAERIDVSAIQSILMMLAQAEILGTPLGPLLRNQTRAFREHKAQMVEKQAMEAPVKMLFPLLVCIFPAILIVLLGPVIMSYMKVQ